MRKGIIVSLDKSAAVVLTPEGEFVTVNKQTGYDIGQEISYTLQVKPRSRRYLMHISAMAASMLLIVMAVWLFRAPTVVAYVSMDINPSIEFGLDKHERVREMRAVNDDARTVIQGVKFRGKHIEDVMDELAHKLVDEHILTTDHQDIVIASVPVKKLFGDWEQEVTDIIKKVLKEVANGDVTVESQLLDITTISVPEQVRDEAEANGVSSGKMAFWLLAESKGYEVSFDTLREQSLKTIAMEWGGVQEVMSSRGEYKGDDKNIGATNDNGNKEPKPTSTPQASKEPKPTTKPSPSPTNGDDDKSSSKPKPSNDSKSGNNDSKPSNGPNSNNNKDDKDTKRNDDHSNRSNDDNNGSKRGNDDHSNRGNNDSDDSKRGSNKDSSSKRGSDSKKYEKEHLKKLLEKAKEEHKLNNESGKRGSSSGSGKSDRNDRD